MLPKTTFEREDRRSGKGRILAIWQVPIKDCPMKQLDNLPEWWEVRMIKLCARFSCGEYLLAAFVDGAWLRFFRMYNDPKRGLFVRVPLCKSKTINGKNYADILV